MTEMPTVPIEFKTLPSGTNMIGNVGVTKLPPLAEGESHIGSVNVQGGVSISSMPPVQVTNDPVRASCIAWEGTISVNHVVFDMGQHDVLKFNYILNEGDTDLFINFDSYQATPNDLKGAGLTGRAATIRMRPGESITDFTRKTSKVNMIRTSGSGTVRILGV
ncbi:hypothetical protein P4645_22700 [Lysinibacillus fusiformis]|uniref:hypothetical protein n=1 Tax=Lysinibacillus fusiformis TaxID=28031 RepID=UPI002E20807C|nr:hypothetical protein [Lysinibacillus fusiformis]